LATQGGHILPRVSEIGPGAVFSALGSTVVSSQSLQEVRQTASFLSTASALNPLSGANGLALPTEFLFPFCRAARFAIIAAGD
jgi:hypothetical protein